MISIASPSFFNIASGGLFVEPLCAKTSLEFTKVSGFPRIPQNIVFTNVSNGIPWEDAKLETYPSLFFKLKSLDSTILQSAAIRFIRIILLPEILEGSYSDRLLRTIIWDTMGL